MSSSDQSNEHPKQQESASGSALAVASTIASVTARWGWTALKVSGSPLFAFITGGSIAFRFVFYSWIGRIIAIGVVCLITYNYLRVHFSQVERGKWEEAVAAKQQEIDNKVQEVNTSTAASQRLAENNISFFDKIFNVVADGIWNTQPKDPIKRETIDLINQTRGKPIDGLNSSGGETQ
jgi:hypothetical protein